MCGAVHYLKCVEEFKVVFGFFILNHFSFLKGNNMFENWKSFLQFCCLPQDGPIIKVLFCGSTQSIDTVHSVAYSL